MSEAQFRSLMTPWLSALGSTLLMLAAGAGVVLWAWPAGHRLTRATAVGLSLLVGPAVMGAVLMCCGAVALTRSTTLAVGLTCSVVLLLAGRWRWSALPHPPASPRHLVPHLLLCIAIAYTSWVSLRTHLGWDGTVVWYHKAKILAHERGWMPVAALQDATRVWAAPDYPLQVPLAEAWLLLAMERHDERALKVLPAAWCAGILCLVFGAVRETEAPDSAGAGLRSVAAVLLVAATPRLIVGEGSFTSGFADGPFAGAALALLWLAWRSHWGTATEWQGLLVLIAATLTWTKQEGVVWVAIIGGVCALRGWRAARFAVPALAIGIGWHLWARAAGAPTTMAYAWPAVTMVPTRLLTVVLAYVREALTPTTWGLFWPALALGTLAGGGRRCWRFPGLLLAALAAGATGLVCSAWGDLAEHARVTVPRQMIQTAPALIVYVCGLQFVRSETFSRQRGRLQASSLDA